MENKKLPDHIEEYLLSKSSHKDVQISKPLFSATKEDIDLKTQLTAQELIIVTIPYYFDEVLKNAKIGNFYESFIDHYLRLKVSQDRGSRSEYVNLLKKDKFDEQLSKFSALKNLFMDKAT